MRETSPGLFSSLRRFCDTVLAVIQNRVELFTIELQEEKHRLVELFIWALAAMVFTVAALLLITFTIVFLFSPEARVYALAVFSLVYVLAAVGAFLVLRNRLRNRPPPFSDTVSELKKDREWLQSRK